MYHVGPIIQQFPFLFLSLRLPILNPFFLQFSLFPSHFHKHLPQQFSSHFLPALTSFSSTFHPISSHHLFSPTFTPFSSSPHLFSPKSHTSFPVPISVSPSLSFPKFYPTILHPLLSYSHCISSNF